MKLATLHQNNLMCRSCRWRDGKMCGISGVPLHVAALRGECPKGLLLPDDGKDDASTHSAAPKAGNGRKPGDLIAVVLARLGYQSTGSCGCEVMRRQMNEWGWWGCWRRRAELVEWFTGKAREVGVTVERESVAGLVRVAMREAWRKRQSPHDRMSSDVP